MYALPNVNIVHWLNDIIGPVYTHGTCIMDYKYIYISMYLYLDVHDIVCTTITV